MKFNLKETLVKYRRVLQVAKKPSIEDMKEVLRICGIGFLIIGAIGFIFYLVTIMVG